MAAGGRGGKERRQAERERRENRKTVKMWSRHSGGKAFRGVWGARSTHSYICTFNTYSAIHTNEFIVIQKLY